MSKDLETLRATLASCEDSLVEAEAARDDWEPDSDNSDHTAPYDAMLDEQGDEELPTWLNHVKASTLMREHNWSCYIDGFNSWEDSLRSERERRRTWSDFDELCDVVEEAESARELAQEALDEAEET